MWSLLVSILTVWYLFVPKTRLNGRQVIESLLNGFRLHQQTLIKTHELVVANRILRYSFRHSLWGYIRKLLWFLCLDFLNECSRRERNLRLLLSILQVVIGTNKWVCLYCSCRNEILSIGNVFWVGQEMLIQMSFLFPCLLLQLLNFVDLVPIHLLSFLF